MVNPKGPLKPKTKKGYDMKSMISIQIILLASMLFPQGTPELSLSVSETKLNRPSGNNDELYYTGDTLLYNITAKNSGDGIMNEAEVIDPIPSGLTYIPESAKGDPTRITFSVDHGMIYQDWPPTYTATNETGEKVIKVCTPEMITHIKWLILEPLNPGKHKNLTFKAKIN